MINKHLPVRITAIPKSWWAIYTEALLGSRGRLTEAQYWRQRIERQQAVLRDAEIAIFNNIKFGRP